jgi:2-polyprenyl-3-methyl-5-hydroxy-6-metoxy-1,4-benzoquinol methylase
VIRWRIWNHNIHYHDLILRSLPAQCGKVLDVGCGQGLLARRLAECCQEVIAIDADGGTLERTQAKGDADGVSSLSKQM